MNVFRKTTLYKIIEETRDWKYKVPGARGRGDNSQLQGSNSRKAAGFSSHDDHSRSQTPNSLSGKKLGQQLAGRGTINLVKNIMRHRLSLQINEQDEMNVDEDNEGQN